MTDCKHDWKYKAGSDNINCFKCNWFSSFDKRWKCQNCLKQICFNCIKKHFNIETKIQENPETCTKPNSRINNLDEKVKNLEEKVDKLESKIESLEESIKNLTTIIEKGKFQSTENNFRLTEITQDELNVINNVEEPCKDHIPLICNKEKLFQITVLAKINIHGFESTTPIIIDTGATSSTIDRKALTEEIKKKIVKVKPATAIQFDGTRTTIDTQLKNIQVKFQTNCNYWSEYYTWPKLWVQDINL